MDLGTSCARHIAENVMIALQMDNANDFRTRVKLINVIDPYLTQIMDAVSQTTTKDRRTDEEMPEESHNPTASCQLRREVHDVIRRYGQESDVTVYQAIGVLEIVKIDLVDMLEKARE